MQVPLRLSFRLRAPSGCRGLGDPLLFTDPGRLPQAPIPGLYLPHSCWSPGTVPRGGLAPHPQNAPVPPHCPHNNPLSSKKAPTSCQPCLHRPSPPQGPRSRRGSWHIAEQSVMITAAWPTTRWAPGPRGSAGPGWVAPNRVNEPRETQPLPPGDFLQEAEAVPLNLEAQH